jgi:hypothetical protein
MILAIDPGVRALGVALFGGLGQMNLMRAALIRNPIKVGNGPEVAFAACEALVRWLEVDARRIETVIVEIPRVYGAAQQKGDQNDLIALAGIGYAASTAIVSATNRVRYFPREWKGTIDADQMTVRIEAKLIPAERQRIEKCPASLRHNVIDAIGIGLKFVGRLEPRRVYPGATLTYDMSPEERLSRES